MTVWTSLKAMKQLFTDRIYTLLCAGSSLLHQTPANDQPDNSIMRAIILLGLVAAVFAQLDRDALRQVFNALDSDDDGSLELSELQAYYDNIDTNKDGFVNLHEYTTSRPAGETAAQTKASFDYNDKLDGVVDNKIARSVVTVVFNRLDANNNGKVSQEEFLEGYAKILAEVAAIVG